MAREGQYTSDNYCFLAECYFKNCNELESFCLILSTFVQEARNQLAALRAYENVFNATDSPNIFLETACAAMWRELLLELAKLFDPSGTGANKNCSFARLKEMCLDDKYADLFPNGENHQFAHLIDTINDGYASIPIKKSRNKQLSHHDVNQIYGQKPVLINFEDVEQLVCKFSSLLETIYSHVSFAEVTLIDYTELVSQYEDALRQLVANDTHIE